MRLLPIPGVFQPPSDAWMLAERLRAEPLPPHPRILDVCTGSGVLAIAAARAHPDAEVVAVDISRRATIAAQLNGWLNGVRVSARRGDLFAAVPGQRFDLIVSNPPYIPGPVEGLSRGGVARAWEAGPDGRVFLDRICAGLGDHLRPGGTVLLVHNAMCGEARTLATLQRVGLDAEVVFRHPGHLGPILTARADWLRRQGLLDDVGSDEVMIIRGRRRAESTGDRLRPAAAVQPATGARSG